MSELIVHAVEAASVEEKLSWFVRLSPLFNVPGTTNVSAVKYVEVPEPFERFSRFAPVYGWTEHALRKMEKFGIAFPVALLEQPIMLPCEWGPETVPVWISSEYDPTYEPEYVRAVVQAGVNVVASGLCEQLTVDDLMFLNRNHPRTHDVALMNAESEAAYRLLEEWLSMRVSESKGSHV
jgi:hypothetical protein